MDIDKKNIRKEIPQMVINGLLFIVNGFVLAMIICLFLFQSREKASVKATIHDFKENVQQYYEEDEAYRQVNDNIDTYKASGRPD
jgi:hypothetical protein